MEQQLNTWKGDLQSELTSLQQQLASLRADIAIRSTKLEAIDKLLGLTPKSSSVTEDATSDSEDDENFTPVKAYWPFILQVLIDLGGRGRRNRVIDAVGEKMKHILTSADYANLKNSNIVRWRNRVAWQASNMRSIGLINKDSPRGLWEITPEGRNWLDTNKG